MTEDIQLQQRIRDMILYQALSGARRVKLEDDWCGYQLDGDDPPLRCFRGHDHFGDEAAWAEHCPGPAYSSTLVIV